ncbi:MAG: cell wall biosynthesis protein [Methanobacteriaceae archaeon]|nr:cell wall biosynthesis protein [Methanobacteriaceae archaeon]MDP2836858.1 cell wall biosynthesis protein [Methanobacteriaceae archaeon]MDP3034514.1 cell wall biosynthesis protein [Methanobacteriaceae archaeon]MDP3485081.1 cell wall biosynthesis protein [Methanobacteriaceae archaeon]MDP3623867.1 cell wall biosynthesis protein [Methanobacteriaceae archaeon]
MLIEILEAGILSAGLTIIFYILIRQLGRKGKIKNLYSSVRGGTPRAVGIAPFLVLIIFLNQDYSYIVAVMGILAFFDDLIGRKKIKSLPVELGQLFRGLGILMVVILGYPLLGPSSILVALMIQPLNIADMQPGSACSTILFMSGTVILLYLMSGNFNASLYFIPLLILALCVGYAPLDYKGKIMMGEVGNHSFAIILGIMFYLYGGFVGLFILFLITTTLIAIIRRTNLQIFLETKLGIENPTFGDYFMDVLTGGGLGDLFRKLILKKRKISIKNGFLIKIGFRRLFYNPF